MSLLEHYRIEASVPIEQFDKIITVQLLRGSINRSPNDPWGSILIDCEKGGLKPSIYFQTEMLPGGVATRFKLSIDNFVAEVDIGLFSHMVVTIGYRTSYLRREFTAAIFSAFIETPNPNGRTTFTGLVGDWFIEGLKEVTRNIIFRQPLITIDELLWGLVEGKGPGGTQDTENIKNGGLGLILEVDLPDWVLRDKLIVGKPDQKETVFWTESGYAALNWLIDRLSSYGDILVNKLREQGVSSDEAERFRVMATLQDNRVLVFMKGFTGNLDNKKIRFISLHRVTSVTFQGAALSIVAPWNPAIMPGSLFHMESRFFRGRMSPQQVITEVARDRADLYRVITMTVEYETNGPNNSMELLAIKNDAFVASEGISEQYTAVERESDFRTNIYVDENQRRDIIFGAIQPVPVEERKTGWGVEKGTFTQGQGTIRKINAAETLGSIANQAYGALTYYKTPSQGNIDHVNEVVPGQYFWPIIAIGNYCMKLNEVPSFENYTETPESLVEGRSVFIPFVPGGNSGMDSLVRLHSILLNIADQAESNINTWAITKQDIQYIRLICYYMELV